MISKSLSTSARRAALHQEIPDLAEFCQQLYPLLVAHSDDFGRLAGDSFTVKHAIDPTSPRALVDFERALQALDAVGLIVWYGPGDRKCISIANFDAHQSGLHRRAVSNWPAPPGETNDAKPRRLGGHSLLDASERDIEEFLTEELESGRLAVGGLRVINVRRQLRTGNSYCDIVAYTAEGITLLVEVKRQRVTPAAIDQVLNYRKMLQRDEAPSNDEHRRIVPIVIGHGLADGLDAEASGVIIGVFSDELTVSAVTSIHVEQRHLTLTHVPSELNLTEQKGTKPKKNVCAEPLRDSAPLLEFPTVGPGESSWPLSEAQVAEWADLFPALDILAEARQALAWVKAMPGRRKTYRGMPKFLVGWFGRTNDRRPQHEPARPRGVAPSHSRWVCDHVERCSHARMCEVKHANPTKYPVKSKVAS